MSKPTRKRRPSMYSTKAQIRRQVKAAIGKEIHAPTGLTYRMVDAMINTEVRYCICSACPNHHEDKTETKHLEIEELHAADAWVVLRPQSRRQCRKPILRRFQRRGVVALYRSQRMDAQRQLRGLAADPVNSSWLNA